MVTELFIVPECSDDHPCEGLSKHAHFQNFGMAFLTLFRVATGDNWNGIMKVCIHVDMWLATQLSLMIQNHYTWTTF